MPKSTGEEWLGTTDVMRLLGVQLRTLYRLIDQGELLTGPRLVVHPL